MNGFLAALVARADARLPVLERRPRSLFEPAPEAAALGVAPREWGQQAERAASASAPGERFGASTLRASRADREVSPPAAPHALQSATNPRAVPARTTRDEPNAHRGSLLLPDHVLITTLRSPPDAHDEGLSTPRAAALSPPDSMATARVARATPLHDEAPSTTRPRVEAQRRDGMSHSAAPRAAAHAPQPIGSLQRRSTALSQPAVVLAKVHSNNATRRDATPSAAPTPAPVQISIGRVEIRAVQSTADRPRAVGPAAPRLSLDDYLRSRNGAAR